MIPQSPVMAAPALVNSLIQFVCMPPHVVGPRRRRGCVFASLSHNEQINATNWVTPLALLLPLGNSRHCHVTPPPPPPVHRKCRRAKKQGSQEEHASATTANRGGGRRSWSDKMLAKNHGNI